MPPGILKFGTRGIADDREGKPVKITGARLSGRGPRPLCLANVFVFHGTIIIYRLYRLSLLDQTQVTRQLRDGLSDLVKIFESGQPLLRGLKKFTPGTKTALGGPD